MKKNVKLTIDEKIINLYSVNFYSANSICKTLLNPEHNKLYLLFCELVAKLDIPANKITGTNMKYFLTVENIEKSNFVIKDIIKLVRTFARFNKENKKITKNSATMFQRNLDNEKLTSKLTRLTGEINELKQLNISEFTEVNEYLHNLDITKLTDNLDKTTELINLNNNLIAEIV